MKNKEQTTRFILELAKDQIKTCTKLSTQVIVFPKWSDLGLWSKVFCMKAKTKENPEGCDYDEKKEQIVIRILDGKLYMSNGMPDVYTLEQDKIATWMQTQDIIIGKSSEIAKKNLEKVLRSIKDETEQEELVNMFRLINMDFHMITVPSQKRHCIEITQELYDAGLTYCVNTWIKPDENGEAEEMKLTVGDFLICKPKENGEGFRSVYRIGHDEFISTHVID